MIRFAIPAVLGAMVIGGCQAEHVTAVGPDARQAISYAATAKYPGTVTRTSRDAADGATVASATVSPATRPVDGQTLAVLDNPDAKEFTIYNLQSRTVPAQALWIDGTYVRETGTIPPRGHVTAKYGEFLEAGNPASDYRYTTRGSARVEVQTADGLFPVLGPGLK